jgi:hypothetical protein
MIVEQLQRLGRALIVCVVARYQYADCTVPKLGLAQPLKPYDPRGTVMMLVCCCGAFLSLTCRTTLKHVLQRTCGHPCHQYRSSTFLGLATSLTHTWNWTRYQSAQAQAVQELQHQQITAHATAWHQHSPRPLLSRPSLMQAEMPRGSDAAAGP